MGGLRVPATNGGLAPRADSSEVTGRRRYVPLWLAISFSIVTPWFGGIAAQALSGQVIDDATGQPVAGVAVQLEDSGRVVVQTVTDSSGSFGLRPPPGEYDLRVQRLGYQTVVHPRMTFAGSDTIQLAIRIGTDAVPLDPISVVVRDANDARLEHRGFYDRRERYQHLSARFLTRADIEARNPGQPTDLFQNIPGVRVVTVGRARQIRTRAGGRCMPDLYLDGHRVGRADAIDDVVLVQTIVAVEVYTGFAVPGPCTSIGGSPCGAVVIWTGVVR